MVDEKWDGMPQQGGVEDRRTWVKTFWDYVEGDILERRFNGRMIMWIIAFTLYAMFQVGFNFMGMRKVKTISDNNNKLQSLKMEYISISTDLMGDSRITSIEKRVEEAGLAINTPKTAPIIIK